jgi:hypothetical protein
MGRRPIAARIVMATGSVCLLLLGLVSSFFAWLMPDPAPTCWQRLAPAAFWVTGIALALTTPTRRTPRRGHGTLLAPLLAVAALGGFVLMLLIIQSRMAGLRDGMSTLGFCLTLVFYTLVSFACGLGAIDAARTARRTSGLGIFIALLGLASALFFARPNYYVEGHDVSSDGWGFHDGQKIWVSETTFSLKPGTLVVLDLAPKWLFRDMAKVIGTANDRVHCARGGALTINDALASGPSGPTSRCEEFRHTLGQDEFLVRRTPDSCACGEIVSRADIVARVLFPPRP